jgi:hypothetical protein
MIRHEMFLIVDVAMNVFRLLDRLLQNRTSQQREEHPSLAKFIRGKGLRLEQRDQLFRAFQCRP